MAFVPRPDYAFVGNHTFSIEWLTTSEWEARNLQENNDGNTFSSLSTIFIRLVENRFESVYQEVLLHELLHAASDSCGMGLDPDWNKTETANEAEERMAKYMAPALLFVLKQNPHLVKWLLSDGTKQR